MQKYALSMVILGVLGLSGCQTTPMTAQVATSHLQPAAQRGEAQARPNQIDFQRDQADPTTSSDCFGTGQWRCAWLCTYWCAGSTGTSRYSTRFYCRNQCGQYRGLLYASGKPAIELRNIALTMRPNDVRDIKLAKKAF